MPEEAVTEAHQLDYSTPPQRQPWLPIRTQQARAPWSWVVMIQLPWFVGGVVENISQVAMTFTLRKFIEIPILITLIGSFNILFNIVIGATCNYASDRIWTRFGRRKPFLVAGYLSTFSFLLVIPLIDSLAVLVLVICLYEALRDVSSPYEPLINEVVPPPQRGRGMAISQAIRVTPRLFFFWAIIGQFDKSWNVLGVSITGEMFVYWVGSAFAFLGICFFTLAVREEKPVVKPAPELVEHPEDAPAATAAFAPPPAVEESEPRVPDYSGPKPPPTKRVKKVLTTVVDFLKDVFGHRQNWLLYMVAVTQMIFWIGLGQLEPLLYTEQFGYDKDIYGSIIGWGSVAFYIAFPLAGFLADKLDRVWLFVGCAIAMTLTHVAFYSYARYFAPEGIPAQSVLIAFGVIGVIINNVGTMASVAMMFDYVETSRMGTVSAGFGISRGVAALLVNNGVGLWITYYSRWFTPGTHDYLSGYQYLILLGCLASLGAGYFAHQVKTGRLISYGVIEQEQRKTT